MLLFHALLTLFLLTAMAYDLRSFIIPNWTNLIILLLYPAMLLMPSAPVEVLGGLYAFLAVFAAGFGLFTFRLMGGGDVKLLAACAPWCGWSPALVQFIFYTTMIGGLMAIVLLLARPIVPWMCGRLGIAPALPRVLMMKEPIPYGLAIAAAFLILLWMGDLPGLPIS